MSNKFNKEYDDLLEGYGVMVSRSLYPRKLNLSQGFVKTLRDEFKSQTSPVMEEDNDGNSIEGPGRSKKQVLKDLQKSIPFLLKDMLR
jgi:hypothetical protein